MTRPQFAKDCRHSECCFKKILWLEKLKLSRNDIQVGIYLIFHTLLTNSMRKESRAKLKSIDDIANCIPWLYEWANAKIRKGAHINDLECAQKCALTLGYSWNDPMKTGQWAITADRSQWFYRTKKAVEWDMNQVGREFKRWKLTVAYQWCQSYWLQHNSSSRRKSHYQILKKLHVRKHPNQLHICAQLSFSSQRKPLHSVIF
jgi:hypothetical protein